MIQKPFRGIQLNRTHPLAKGLVSCWLFNEATGETVFDLSGNGNNGTLKNGVAWGGNGLEIDGVNDYVDCGNNISFGTDDFTISAWVYEKTRSSSYPAFLGKGDTGAGEWMFRDDGTGRVSFYGDGGNIHAMSGGVIFSLNTLHHLIATRSGSILNIYFDGLYVAQDTSAGADLNDTTSLRIGSADGDPNRWWHGSVNNVQIYNHAKSPAEASWLYREPYAMFEPTFNPALLYSAAPPVGAIMNQFQKANIGADLYNGVFA